MSDGPRHGVAVERQARRSPCACGKPSHPSYGSKCEDCYALLAGASTMYGSVPLGEQVKLKQSKLTDYCGQVRRKEGINPESEE